MQINYNDLSLQQLHEIDDALEEFIFSQPARKGDEPFAPTFRKDPKHFRALIRELVSFKKDLMSYFKKLYEDRWRLMNQYTIPLQHHFDEYDDYFDDDEWNRQDVELAGIIEEHKKKSYALGLLSLFLLLGLGTKLTAEDAQKKLLDYSLDMSKKINAVTRKRIKSQIEASVKLNEDRAAFEERLKKVFINSMRGQLIAEHEALQSYTDARQDMAIENNLQYKIWDGVQTETGEICGSVIGEVVPINDNFSNGLDGPLAHVRCKCSLDYTNTPG